MRLDTLLLADHAATSEGKLYVNGGGITRFNVPALPFAIPMLSVIVRMLTDDRDVGEHRFLLEFLNPDNVQALPPEPVDVVVGPRPPDAIPGEETFIQFVASFGGLPILRSGIHRLRVSWDDKLIRELALPVVDMNAETSPLGKGAPVPRPTARKNPQGRRTQR